MINSAPRVVKPEVDYCQTSWLSQNGQRQCGSWQQRKHTVTATYPVHSVFLSVSSLISVILKACVCLCVY